MAAPREFRQRRFGVRTSFEFRDESFGYGIADVAAGRAQLVHYEALDVRSPGQYVIGNQHYIGRFVLVPVLLLLLDWGFLPETRLPSLVPMVVLALAGLSAVAIGVGTVSNLVAVRFTEIPSLGTDAQGVRAFVRIVQDRQHDAILAELEARWCARLRSLYGSVDPTNDPIREAAKFDQLLRLGVVSEEEHEQTAEQLRSLAAGVAGPLPATRH